MWLDEKVRNKGIRVRCESRVSIKERVDELESLDCLKDSSMKGWYKGRNV